MTAPLVKGRSVGLRSVHIFALDSDGYPAATNTTAYEGVAATGARLVNVNDPEPRRITHFGDDRVLQLDVLPPTEAMTGELRTGTVNDDLDALLTGLNSFTVDTEVKGLLINTDKKGNEPQVGVVCLRQSLDTNGKRVWRSLVFPRAILVPRESSLDENPEDRSYPITPQIVTKHLWGVTFATTTEGATEGQAVRLVSESKLKVVAWKAPGGAIDLALPTAKPAVSTDKMYVFVGGAADTVTTLATTQLQYNATDAPTANAIVTLVYEHA